MVFMTIINGCLLMKPTIRYLEWRSMIAHDMDIIEDIDFEVFGQCSGPLMMFDKDQALENLSDQKRFVSATAFLLLVFELIWGIVIIVVTVLVVASCNCRCS